LQQQSIIFTTLPQAQAKDTSSWIGFCEKWLRIQTKVIWILCFFLTSYTIPSSDKNAGFHCLRKAHFLYCNVLSMWQWVWDPLLHVRYKKMLN
jgi:hypothetical protein